MAKGYKTGGRQKGSQNKVNKELKQMILDALDEKGGTAYLARQADENPTAFIALIGRVLPMTVQGPGDDGEVLFKWQD